MNALQAISLSRLTAHELSSTATTVLSIVEPLTTDPFISRQTSEIRGSLNELRSINSTPLATQHTGSINEIDAKIDNLIPIIETDLQSSVDQKDFFPEKAAAAESLLKLFNLRDRHKLLRGGYTDQGEELQRLFKDVFAPDMDTIRETSGTAVLFNTLKEWVEKMTELLGQRLQEGNLPTTSKEQRSILRFRLENLLTYINANIVDEVEGFAAVQTEINELITDVMSKVKARYTRKENQESLLSEN